MGELPFVWIYLLGCLLSLLMQFMLTRFIEGQTPADQLQDAPYMTAAYFYLSWVSVLALPLLAVWIVSADTLLKERKWFWEE